MGDFFSFSIKEANRGNRIPAVGLGSQSSTTELHSQYNAEGRARTDTIVTYRRILSPVRLPIPPPRLFSMSTF